MGRQRRINRDELISVWREAKDSGVSPRKAIMEVLDLSEGRVDYYLRQMRDDGILPATRPSARDHAYVTATINRGTSRERRWTVCQVCLTPECALGQADRTPVEGAPQ